MPSPGHRASDAEREAVAERLRSAAADGRLEPDELDERLGAAYAARTTAELAPLTGDLPGPGGGAVPAQAPVRSALRSPTLRRQLAGFLVANLVAWSVWLATGGGADVWPKWVLLGTGLVVVATLVRVAVGPEADDDGPPGPPRRRRRRRR